MGSWSIRKLRKRLNYSVLMSKIFRFLENDDWQVKVVRIKEYSDDTHHLHGVTDYVNQIIYIDVRSELLPTLIHECLHPLMVDWKGSAEIQEKFIRIMERFLSARLTGQHISKLRNFLCTKDKFLAKSFPVYNDGRDTKDRQKYYDSVLDKLLKP